MPSLASRALAHALSARDRRHLTIRAAINASSPHYSFIETMDEGYKLYHYADSSYIMVYQDRKRQDYWLDATSQENQENQERKTNVKAEAR